MAYFVAKTLHMRPNEILDEWSAQELAVAYGQYTNEISSQNYEQWKSYDSETRSKIPKPDKYFVKFYGTLNDESE